MDTQTLIRLIIGLLMTAVVLVFAAKRVLWLTNLTTFVLQSNANLAQPNAWSDVSGSPGVAGTNFFRDFPPNPSPLFFRLRSP